MRNLMVFAVFFFSEFAITGCATSNPNTFRDTVREIGYIPIALPSNVYQPGKVVYITDNDPFQASTVCELANYIGPQLPTKNEAASLSVSEKLTNTYSLGTDVIKQISGNIDYSLISDIKVTLANVSVEEIPDDLVFTGISSQTPGCVQAIRKLNHNHVGFIQEAFKADATYEVIFNKGIKLDGPAQDKLLNVLAIKLGGEYKRDENKQIHGSNLYWGVKPPRKDLVLTPLRISELQLLDEKYTNKVGNTSFINKLLPRSSTSFDYKNNSDLLFAIVFTIDDFMLENNSSIDIDSSLSFQDAEHNKLANISLPHFSNTRAWEQMPNVKTVGVENVRNYLNLPTGSIAYLVIIDQFNPSEIPKGNGIIEISVTDNLSHKTVNKSLNIQVNQN